MSTATLLPGIVRIGHTRISVFGFFAAAGLVAAVWLSQRTARMAGVSAQSLWDAGVFAVFSAFVLSRLLLVVQDWHAFVRYPLLVLSLPSLTYAGIALTAVATLLYLRAVKLPLAATLDAWAPSAALLGAVLALAHFVEGTDAGMPTALPWGVITPGDSVLGRVHPVQIYIMLAALYLLFDTLRLLRRPHVAGVVAAHALYLGGGLFFLLDMLAQPVESRGAAWLDPGQWVALGCFATGAAMRLAVWSGTSGAKAPNLSRSIMSGLKAGPTEEPPDPTEEPVIVEASTYHSSGLKSGSAEGLKG